MKRFFWVVLLVLTLGLPACVRKQYKDGVYSAETQSSYTMESFYGQVKIRIKNHKIAGVDFQIMDKANNDLFDAGYGDRHFVGYDLYMDQARHDWAGVQTYPRRLLKAQDLGRVEAMAGATWSYNLFKDAAALALAKAE